MKRAAIAFAILFLSVLSCQPFSTLPGGEGGTEQQPTATALPGGEGGAEQQPTATALPGNEGGADEQPADVDLAAYFLPDPAVGLDSLQGYAQTLSISFNGTEDGEPVEYTDTYYQVSNRETHTQFTYMDITYTDGSREQIVFGNAGEAYYSKSEGEKCHVSWGERATGVEPFFPADLLSPLLGAQEDGVEEVSGVQTRRYTFDAVSLGYPSSTRVEGQVWLAIDGGYVVKYSMHIQDEGAFFGEGVRGEQVTEYVLDQINAVSGPELPEGCLPVLTDMPAMPDATEVQRLPQVLAYTSPSDMSQIQSFYEQRLQDLGWALSVTHPYPADATVLVFLHTEDSRIAYVTLQAAGTDTWVTVKVEPME